MKMNKLFLLLASAFMLAGCNFKTGASKKSSNDDTTSENKDDENKQGEDQGGTGEQGGNTGEDEKEEEFEHLTTNTIVSGSYSGSLIEILTDRYLEVGQSYACAFTTSTNLNKTLTFKSKYDTVATVSVGATAGSFTINALKVGDTIVYAYDVEGTMCLRVLVQVRKAIALDKVASHLFNVDKWESTHILGTYTLTFVNENPLTGMMAGYDDMEQTSIVFDLIDGKALKMYDFNFYEFSFVLDMDQYQSQREYVCFRISATGDYILIYYSSGTETSLLEMFSPVVSE